ncbi:MAG: hypothetical protein RBS99_14850 [Rhodospirillales bacterium]|jgi:hypothetical protein|nr:hypothetical protein [Rhodospirillales bacterium]
MTSYRITFYRHLMNRSGYPFKSSLSTVRVSGPDRSRAFSEAARRFEYDWSLYEWSNLADEFEIVEEAAKRPDASA